MRRVAVLFALLSCNCTLVAGARQSTARADPAPILAVEHIGRGAVPIDGEWQFHLGDDMGWAAPSYDDSEWERITANKTWGAQTHPSYTGFAWYRRHLYIPASPFPNRKLAILMPPVESAYEIYWNGEKVGNQGVLPPGAVWYYQHRESFALPSPSGAERGLLAIRTWRAPLSSISPDNSGGLTAPPLIGGTAVIAAKVGEADFLRLNASLFGRALSFFFLLIGTVSFFAWLEDREKKLYLWFAIWLLGEVAYFYLHSIHMIEWLPYPILGGLRTVVLSIADCSLFLLLLYLFDLEDNGRLLRWTWAAVAIHLGFGLADAVQFLNWRDAGRIMQWLNAVVTAVWTLPQLMVFVLVYQGLKRKLDLPRKLVAVAALLLYLWDFARVVSSQGIRFTHWSLHDRITGPLFSLAGVEVTSGQILEALLLISLAYALMRYAMEQSKHEEALEMELKSAREVQQVMIPEALPKVAGYAIHSVYQPAQEVGGDFFQIISLADESSLVVLGDVSGKGLKAAMNVALIIGTVRTLAEFERDPKEILTGLNRRLVGRMQGGFTTALLLKLDYSGHCTLANAGHLPPFLNGNEFALNESLPLGIIAEAEFADQSFMLQRGDRLILYTDGVPEARDKRGELYGFERTRTLVSNNSSAESIAQAASDFGQEDDITVLTIEPLPVDESTIPEIIDSARLAGRVPI